VDTSSLTTKRTIRSQTRTVNGGHASPPSPSQPGSCASSQPGGSNTNRRSSRAARKRKRKWGSSTSGATLTETAVWHLCKRQKMTNRSCAGLNLLTVDEGTLSVFMINFLLFGPSIFYFAHVLLSHTYLVTLLCSFLVHQMYNCIREGNGRLFRTQIIVSL